MKKRWVSQQAFTIVELLIVIVVIGILAAITIIAYNGISTNAKIASVKVDLEGSAKQLAIYKTGISSADSYPTGIDCTASPAANTICLKSANGGSYVYSGSGTFFCLKETINTIIYSVSSDNSSPTTPPCVAGLVSTLAGSTQGYLDGTGTGAKFNGLGQGLAVDSSGNVFVSDYIDYRIRKITPAGVVTTFAGSGALGSANGTGTAATFAGPNGLAFDSSGNLYVADQPNNMIRKITPAGVVTTFAGSTTSGTADGTGVAAQFNAPASVAVDSSNNVYVADYGNNRIRKITSAGVVTTLAGSSRGYLDATGTSAQFNLPNQLTVTASGTVYVSDTFNNLIRKVTSAGVVTTYAGDGTAGAVNATGTAAEFNTPLGITVQQDGTLYIADQGNARVRAISPAGVVTTVAGSTAGYTEGYATSAQFNNPGGIVVTSTGIIYLTDRGNYVVRKIQ